MSKPVHVVAAVIRNAEQEILLALRPSNKHMGGLWEFPGGKCEFGEHPVQALARELYEELGIIIDEPQPLIQVRHSYPDLDILLDVYEVQRFTGQAYGAEGQTVRWVAAQDLTHYQFPAANRTIVTAAQLPKCYLITPEQLSIEELYEGVEQALVEGCELVQLRAEHLSEREYKALAARLQRLCAGRAQLLLKGDLAWQDAFSDVGWHLTAQQLQALQGQQRPLAHGRMLAASCHNAEELQWAAELEVDFVTLSPVLPTQTHPNTVALGWDAAQQLLLECNMPVFLLGGLHIDHLHQARSIGGQGVAGIRAFWPQPLSKSRKTSYF
ncbi:Nudix family hydrolase [Denitrificimonas sp. JX-1]|uniref:8-oxo-dGTP diphosphatase n=1 Tax=Denitrificimonas halotolerans TaxID=3098930 RepID=A0ABU5GTB0_9GAMM|nr:Nudix family hydrolase [Denitrificimonas sp. JX-1]MDY7220236.1 Nudix family hydrolase [Denitrificimonas sp. JX-1]